MRNRGGLGIASRVGEADNFWWSGQVDTLIAPEPVSTAPVPEASMVRTPLALGETTAIFPKTPVHHEKQ